MDEDFSRYAPSPIADNPAGLTEADYWQSLGGGGPVSMPPRPGITGDGSLRPAIPEGFTDSERRQIQQETADYYKRLALERIEAQRQSDLRREEATAYLREPGRDAEEIYQGFDWAKWNGDPFLAPNPDPADPRLTNPYWSAQPVVAVTDGDAYAVAPAVSNPDQAAGSSPTYLQQYLSGLQAVNAASAARWDALLAGGTATEEVSTLPEEATSEVVSAPTRDLSPILLLAGALGIGLVVWAGRRKK